MTNDTFELDLVDEIPAPQRNSGGYERDTELKRFCRALSERPVGAKAAYKRGVRSPNYGGEQVAEKFPNVQFSVRRDGSTTVEKDGQTVDVPTYTIYGQHIDPATRRPKRAKAETAQEQAEDEGLLA